MPHRAAPRAKTTADREIAIMAFYLDMLGRILSIIKREKPLFLMESAFLENLRDLIEDEVGQFSDHRRNRKSKEGFVPEKRMMKEQIADLWADIDERLRIEQDKKRRRAQVAEKQD